MSSDREQDTVDVLNEAGATTVVETGTNKFRIGSFPSFRRVMLAYYGGYGGWQFEFADMAERDRQIADFLRAGVPATPAPQDSTRRRMAVGHERGVALKVARILGGADAAADAARTVVRRSSSPAEAPPSIVRRPALAEATRPAQSPAAPVTPPARASHDVFFEHDWTRSDVASLEGRYTREELAELAKLGFTAESIRRFLGVS
jgi:hypothetical protein